MMVYYFGSEGCPQCRAMKPMVETWCRAKGVTMVDVDVEEDDSLTASYNIRNIPTAVVKDGETVVARLTGIDKWKAYEVE